MEFLFNIARYYDAPGKGDSADRDNIILGYSKAKVRVFLYLFIFIINGLTSKKLEPVSRFVLL